MGGVSSSRSYEFLKWIRWKYHRIPLWGIFAGIFLIGITFSGCRSKMEEITREDEIYHGNQLIQEGRYDEAIGFFQTLEQDHPSLDSRLGLASAHAAKAGIFVHHYWGFAVGFSNEPQPGPIPENLYLLLRTLDNAKNTSYLTLQQRLEVEGLIHVLEELGRLLGRFTNLPFITITGKDQVEKAFQLLSGIPSKGARIYRAILAAVLFKYFVSSEIESWQTQINYNEISRSHLDFEILCQLPLLRILNSLGSIYSYIEPLEEDLIFAFPSQELQLRSHFFNARSIMNQFYEGEKFLSNFESMLQCQR